MRSSDHTVALKYFGLVRQSWVFPNQIQSAPDSPFGFGAPPGPRYGFHQCLKRQKNPEGEKRRCRGFLRGPLKFSCNQQSNATPHGGLRDR